MTQTSSVHDDLDPRRRSRRDVTPQGDLGEGHRAAILVGGPVDEREAGQCGQRFADHLYRLKVNVTSVHLLVSL